MQPMLCFFIILTFIGFLSAHQCEARSPGNWTSRARSLDALLQDCAYRAFVLPRTGVPYDGEVPPNITGVKVAVLRLRNGSLRSRGYAGYKEFRIPTGVVVQPYVERVALVYQNLGNLSAAYYPLPGYTYLAPVLGLLAYNAANLSGTNLSELDVVASRSPMSINFTDVGRVPSGLVAKCVWFGLNGSLEFRDLASSNVCSAYRQGHFAIVANSTGLAPAPTPSGAPSPGAIPRKCHKSEVWKIVGAAVGGFVVLFLLGLLLAWLHQYEEGEKVTEMERRADVGEALRKTRVGNTQAPAALGIRTQPFIEDEYVP